MCQPYLPQLYVESDSDATSCYLFFRRMGYKADLINNVVAQIHNLPESLNGDVSEVLVGVCEVNILYAISHYGWFVSWFYFLRCEVGFLVCQHCASGLPPFSDAATLKLS